MEKFKRPEKKNKGLDFCKEMLEDCEDGIMFM